jgi:hypothetical protein
MPKNLGRICMPKDGKIISGEPFEIKNSNPQDTQKKRHLRKYQPNLDTISSNLETNPLPYHLVITNPRAFRKNGSYISC